MRVLHLEMPRELSFTVRPWRRDLYLDLVKRGHEFSQRDLNAGFWRTLLTAGEDDLFGRLLNARYQNGAFNCALAEQCAARCRTFCVDDGVLGLGGFRLDEHIASDTSRLWQWTRSAAVINFWQPWLAEIDAQFDQADLVSFGVASADELALAGVIAEHLQRCRPALQTCLTYHRWENFSLLRRLPELIEQGALLDLFDAVVLDEDAAGSALASLCDALASGTLTALHSIAVQIDGAPVRHGPALLGQVRRYRPLDDQPEEQALSAYLRSVGIPPASMLMLDALVRNDCHYGKCTFCVQNVGYATPQQYKHAPELERALALVEHLAARHGVSHFSFADQAVAPALLERVCDRLSQTRPAIQWCVRMLPDAALAAQDQLARARSLGCREILLGLESTCPETLKLMGKPQRFNAEVAWQWLARCEELGINVTLSAIRAFPGESEADFATHTAAFLATCQARFSHVTVIVNDFTLFAASQIAAAPSGYGVMEVERQGGDMEFILDYRDVHGRYSRDRFADVPNHASAMDVLRYTSIGLLHRWDTGRWIDAGLNDEQACSPFLKMRDTLVLGCNGYLGRQVARSLPSDKLIVSSRSAQPALDIDAPYISQDLCSGPGELALLSPATVWVCARPLTDSFPEFSRFQMQLQCLLDSWARAQHLRRLIIFSTQLVAATPADGEQVCGHSPLAPQAPYDCAMAQLEVFAGYLARTHGIAVDVVRLPLLWGGDAAKADLDTQLLHRWRAALAQGERWQIEATDLHYGNSWVDMQDLIDAIERDASPGLRVRSAKSGDFTYAELQQRWGAGAPSGATMALVKSRFLVADEFGLPPRSLFD